MMIKLTSAFIAAALLLPSSLASLQCALTSRPMINKVEFLSASDLAARKSPWEEKNWAEVTLNGSPELSESQYYIAMRHDGDDCSDVNGAQHYLCNKDYVDKEPGNSCAQVAHQLGEYGTLRTFRVPPRASNPSVQFSATLVDSLQSWEAGVSHICGLEKFDAGDIGLNKLTFSASAAHEWTNIVVTLNEPDANFPNSWSCNDSNTLVANNCQFKTVDNKVWTIDNVMFQPRYDTKE
ncbi:uncharacterized protein MEPE_00012 [Melanopsichium pennsylvanicum]|uniref:AA1-like domain-containing protein n=1 Tax=Melanopsichium pennsylvanicum TaxID=63383 RepID=A0AAJ4XFB3_9BASI|nr:uncharacterized protein MEPE_00012 [Melanopsichium pennsylvanicum]